MNNNQINGIIDVGGLQFKSMDDIFTSDIKSIEDFKKLNKKIEKRISYYRLDSLLLTIHDFFLSDVEKKYPPFIAAMITKYAILNSNMHSGWSPISDDEFLPIIEMVTECAVYDPEFDLSNKSLEEKEEIGASFLLRKIGSQSRLDIPLHNVLGGTIYLYEEMAKDKNAPPFIKKLVNSQFEELFGVSIFDFLKIGFLLFSGSANKGVLTGEYFEKARKRGLSIPNNEVVNNCLKQIACDQYQFRKICRKNKSKEEYYESYELNPLLEYPIIRLWKHSNQNNPKDDKFIAPVPNLLIYRLTTGLYYQLFNMKEGKEKFSREFGKLFEDYTGKLLRWYKLPDKILSADEIKIHIPGYKKKNIKIPDWVIFCEEGVILIECKATGYSQDMYERGLKAEANSCIKQIRKGIIQMNEFETQIPILCEKFGKNYTDLQVQKIIVSYENLLGLRVGFLKNYIDKEIIKNGYSTDWKTLWIWELEEIQPYITGGANFWSFLIDIENKCLNVILKEMKSKTDASYSDGILYKYQNKLFSELMGNIDERFRAPS